MPENQINGVIFKTRDITKEYITGETIVRALRGVSVDIEAGELIVLLGPSGSGKSTFLNIIGGLDQPSSGEVFFKNHNLSHYTDRELTLYRRENVGFVFQAYNLVPSLTAFENVSLVTEISSTPLPTQEALNAVGLEDRGNHFPSQLSGGEQQRIAIARALAKRPEILLCDEPTGALDSETGIMVLAALQKANKTFGTTTIIITHNVTIADMADRVIHFADGKVAGIDIVENPKSPEEMSW